MSCSAESVMTSDHSLTINKEIIFKYDNISTIEEAYGELIKFMKTHKSDANTCKFRSYGNPFIGMDIPEEEYDTLAELLSRYSILDKGLPQHGICIGRKQNEKHLLMIDLDVKTTSYHKFTEYYPFFYKLAQAISKHIGSQSFKVYTRKEYQKDNLCKNGAHVLFTDIVVNPGITVALESDDIKDCLQDIYNIDTSVDIKDIIDKVSFGNGLIGLLGSRKPESKQYWEVTLQNDEYRFSCGMKYTEENVLKRMMAIKETMLFPRGNEIELCDQEQRSIRLIFDQADQVPVAKVTRSNKELFKEQPDFISKLVDLIGKQYLTNYESWLKIGMAIKQSGGTVELFDKISQKAKNYDSFNAIKTKWESFKDDYHGNKVTIGTLKYYARLSDPVGYESLCERNKTLEYVVNNYTDCLMVDYLCTCNDDASNFIKKLRCRCNKEVNRVGLCVSNWYSYNGVYYKEIDEGVIKEKLFDSLYQRINCIYKDYKAVLDVIIAYEECEGKKDVKNLKKSNDLYNIKEILESINGDNKKKLSNLKKVYQNLVKNAKTVRDKINDSSERNKLLTVLQDKTILKNTEYISEFNNQQSTVVFENGVYDAFEKKMIHSEKNTFSCRRNFVQPTQHSIDIFDKYMASLFPDVRVRTLMYELLAKMLTPDPIQYIIFFTGVGSNGKSVFITFLEKLLGDYFKGVSGAFFSGEVKKGSCDPELVDTIHRRCISVNEPAKNNKLAGSFIKSLTGDDYITARGLYKDNVTWKPTAKHIITCNDIPSTDDLTEGFKRRLIIIPFTAKFLTEEAYKAALEEGEEDVALRDDLLIRELMKPETLDEIASLLVTKYYNIRCAYDLPDPCKKFNMEYIKSNDPFDSWIEECLTIDADSTVEMQVLYDNYKNYIELNTNEKKLPKVKFETLLKQKTKCSCAHVGKRPVTGVRLN